MDCRYAFGVWLAAFSAYRQTVTQIWAWQDRCGSMPAQVITADPVTDVHRKAKAMLTYRLSAMLIVDRQDALVSRYDISRSVDHDPPLSLWS